MRSEENRSGTRRRHAARSIVPAGSTMRAMRLHSPCSVCAGCGSSAPNESKQAATLAWPDCIGSTSTAGGTDHERAAPAAGGSTARRRIGWPRCSVRTVIGGRLRGRRNIHPTGAEMSDEIEGFFHELGGRGHEPLLAKVTGSVRFDVVDGDRTDRWLVTINRGDVTVQDPRRQHVRRERRSGRHRGLADRPDGPVLVRHTLSVEVGADRERERLNCAVHRRPPVLRGPVLPRARHRHRLRRRQAVGDPTAGGGQRLPRAAVDPQPRQAPPSTSRCGSTPTPTSPTCSRSRTPWRRRARTPPGRRRQARAHLPARHLRASRPGSRRHNPAPSTRRDDVRVTIEPHGSGRPTSTWSTAIGILETRADGQEVRRLRCS
jgi:hypothetical protein